MGDGFERTDASSRCRHCQRTVFKQRQVDRIAVIGRTCTAGGQGECAVAQYHRGLGVGGGAVGDGNHNLGACGQVRGLAADHDRVVFGHIEDAVADNDVGRRAAAHDRGRHTALVGGRGADHDGWNYRRQALGIGGDLTAGIHAGACRYRHRARQAGGRHEAGDGRRSRIGRVQRPVARAVGGNRVADLIGGAVARRVKRQIDVAVNDGRTAREHRLCHARADNVVVGTIGVGDIDGCTADDGQFGAGRVADAGAGARHRCLDVISLVGCQRRNRTAADHGGAGQVDAPGVAGGGGNVSSQQCARHPAVVGVDTHFQRVAAAIGPGAAHGWQCRASNLACYGRAVQCDGCAQVASCVKRSSGHLGGSAQASGRQRAGDGRGGRGIERPNAARNDRLVDQVSGTGRVVRI